MATPTEQDGVPETEERPGQAVAPADGDWREVTGDEGARSAAAA